MKTLKYKPSGYTSFDWVREDIPYAVGFLTEKGIKAVMVKYTWVSRIAVPLNAAAYCKALLNSYEFIEQSIAKYKQDGGDPRSLSECIAFSKTLGLYAGTIAEINTKFAL